MFPALRLCSRVVKSVSGNPWLRLFLVVGLAIVFYNEWLCYFLQSMSWPSMNLQNKSPKSIKLLIISDAQIIGEKFETGLFGMISRFDSDRYLEKSFELCKHYVKPDMLVFLGDNFDEGSIASDEEYNRYAQRFFNNFITDNITYLSVPGDNDIGGEGVDYITKEKVDRFNQVFGKDTVYVRDFIDFVKVSLISRDSSLINFPAKSSNLRVVLTHIPLLIFQDHFASKVMEQTGVNLVISGHDHKSHIIAADRKSGNILLDKKWDSHKFFTYSLSENKDVIVEIIVPTCSYRMGVQKMGFGLLIVEPDGRIHYSVLWSKPRFPLLFVYLAYVLVLLAFVGALVLINTCNAILVMFNRLKFRNIA